MLLVDTSALYAFLSASDRFHEEAARIFRALSSLQRPVGATSYVLLETIALLQARQGVPAARRFVDGLAPVLEIVWVDESIHAAAWELVRKTSRRSFSLVDASTVAVASIRGVEEVFAFDPDFRRHGLRLLPS